MSDEVIIKSIYTDGGYKDKIGVSGFVVVDTDNTTILYEEFVEVSDKESLKKLWNVAAEIDAASSAIRWTENSDSNIKYNLYSDYQGIQGWAQSWKTNNRWTKNYSKLAKSSSKIEKYIFVRGHSKNKWNEYVDKKLNELLENLTKQNGETHE